MSLISVKSAILCAAMGASLLALTSCQDEEFGYSFDDVRVGAYNRNFADVFGTVDPEQTWNTATQVSLDVNICFDGEYTIKVYTANPRYPENNAYLAGQYDNVTTGQHLLRCDLPASVEYAYVGLIDAQRNRIILPAQVVKGKASVTFGSDETTRSLVFGDGTTSEWSHSQGEKRVTTLADIKTPLATLPERTNNTGKVSQNFEYVSMGEFEIYPIYSITSNQGSRYGNDRQDALFGERLGIYTYGAWGDVRMDDDTNLPKITWIWHMNRGSIDENGNLTNGCWYQAHKTNEDDYNWHDMYWFENNFWTTDQALQNRREPHCVWQNNKFKDGYDKIRTDAIVVNIPAGTRFGFVLDTDHGYVFSNSTYNKDEGNPNGTELDHLKDTYAATFHTDNTLYLAFEDWGYNDGNHDNDFNDLVMKLQPTGEHINPLIIDKDTEASPILYIVACEDLGGTFDWDFNDVVFGIEHVSGQTQARVKLLAAGGTLPISLTYESTNRNADITFTDPRDGQQTVMLHAAFGAEDDVPVNVVSGGFQASATYSDYFRVDADAFSVLDGAADFKVHVKYGKSDNENEKLSVIHVPNYGDKSKSPQAFLIADPKWQWPAEHQNITSLYPEFSTWVGNFQGTSNWTNTLWGTVREINSIPSYATNLFNFINEGAITYNGNVATISLRNGQMEDNASYKLAVLVSDEATAQFLYNNNSQIADAPHGTIIPNKLTTFTISGSVVNAIKSTGQDGKVTLTFAQGTWAEGKLLSVYWYKAGTLVSSNLIVPEANKTINMEVDDVTAIVYTTENQDSPVLFSSSNDVIATVDANGNITARAAGDVTITLSQAATEHYQAAEQTVTVHITQPQVYVPNAPIALVPSMMHSWSDKDCNSITGDPSGVNLKLNQVVSNGSGFDYVFGSGIYQNDYVDLCSSDYLVAVVSNSYGDPVFHLNNGRQNGSETHFEIYSSNTTYLTKRTNYDNTTTWVIDLKKIREDKGKCHLNAITNQWTGSTYVLSLQLDKYDCQKDQDYITRLLCEGSYQWSDLTQGDYHRWSSVYDDSYQSGSPYFNLYPYGNDGADYGYGNSNVIKEDYAKLNEYTVLRVKTPYSVGRPRFVFNRMSDSSNDILSITLDVDHLFSNRYIRPVDTGSGYGYYVNLKAIHADYGFVHLNCIKTEYGTGSLVLSDGVKVGK